MGIPMGMPMNGNVGNNNNGFPAGMPGNNFQGGGPNQQMSSNGYGNGAPPRRGGRGGARGGRGGPSHLQSNGFGHEQQQQQFTPETTTSPAPQQTTANGSIHSPQPVSLAAAPASAPSNGISYPERPGTPTLCKFGMTCTNPICRYSHPSPAASVESGLVLSNEACEKGAKCVDKDCTKGHPSPAVLDPNAVVPTPASSTPHRPPSYKSAQYHPYSSSYNNHKATTSHSSTLGTPAGTPCRFGSGCTRASCPFQHPAGRTTLPGEFHRGLRATDPTITLSPAQEKARMMSAVSANRFNKTVTFNKPGKSAATAAVAPTTSASSVTASSDSQDAADSVVAVKDAPGKAGTHVIAASETATEA